MAEGRVICVAAAARPAPTTPYSKAGSVRSNRAAVGWAKKAANAPSSLAAYDNGSSAARGQKIIVYVIGGITHRYVGWVLKKFLNGEC
jgi:hypothetical protein